MRKGSEVGGNGSKNHGATASRDSMEGGITLCYQRQAGALELEDGSYWGLRELWEEDASWNVAQHE